jgi:hypothetical protein
VGSLFAKLGSDREVFASSPLKALKGEEENNREPFVVGITGIGCG